MKIKYLYYTVFFVSVSIFYACKKDKTNIAPVITVTTPYEGQQVAMFDTLTVLAHVSDDEKLTTISVGLENENFVSVQEAYPIAVTSNDQNVLMQYPIFDYLLPSGIYYLTIKASDGLDITTNHVKLYLTASPTYKKQVYLFSHDNNQTNVSIIDSVNVFKTQFNLSQYHAGDAVCSYYQRLVVAQGGSQSVNFYNPQNAISFSSNFFSSFAPYYLGVKAIERDFVIYFSDGRTTKYTYSGQQKTDYPYSNSDYYTTNYHEQDNESYIAMKSWINGQNKVVVFNKNTGISIQEGLCNFEIVALLKKDLNEVFVLGNNGNQGVISIYSKNGNGYYSPLNLPNAKVLCACSLPNNDALFAMSDGNIYRYNYSTNNYYSVYNGAKCSKLYYSEPEALIYGSFVNELKCFSLPTTSMLLNSNYVHNDTIVSFDVLFNK